MSYPITITGDAIPLPKGIATSWRGRKVIIINGHDHILIESVASQSSTNQNERLALWKQAAGMLRGKLPKDPVAWQRKIRREWERNLPWSKR